MAVGQENFAYHTAMVSALEASISTDRITTYLNASGHNKVKALKLYLWNAKVSEAFHIPLQTAEVTLRNSIHESLVVLFGLGWPEEHSFKELLSDEGCRSISKTKNRILNAKKPVTTGRIVAGLSFDFWASLLTARFDRTVWQVGLRSSFPNLPGTMSRGDIRNLVVAIKDFRNRVAHHEPILGIDLSNMHADILRLVRFRCEHTASWVKHHSSVQAVIRQRPR